MRLLKLLGLAPTQEDLALKSLIDNGFKSVRVVGRGTVRIDPNEVITSPEFKRAQARVKELFPHLGQ